MGHDEDTPMFAGTKGGLQAAAESNSRSSVESSLETLNFTVENLFDEIHRLGSRISPVLLEQTAEKPVNPGMTTESGSTVREQINGQIARLHNAICEISNYYARIDL